jgi:glucose-1-phosphate adenylyltransferase
MPGCDIGANCRLSNVFVDNSCLVCNGTVIGEDLERDRRNFDITENGVVVVNREMMGQGVQYMPGITPEDMQSA